MMNGHGAHDLVAGEVADPQRHFHIIDAFQMPRWSWSHSRWEKQAKGTLLPPATAKPMHLAQRLAIIRSAVERNSNFMPPLAIGGAVERQRFMKLTSTKNLLGRPGQRFLLFGMLSTTEDGRYALEDADGVVGLDLQDAVPGEGIFTEGSFILVEGEYTQEERIRAAAIGHPPGESRKAARKLWSDTDFNGTGAISLNEESLLKVHEQRNDDVCMIFISEFHLDHHKTMASFRAMLQGFVDAQFIPFAFVLCGNFLSAPHQGGDTVRLYQDAFAQLGDLLLSYPSILTRSRFIFVPGPSDPFPTPLLPRPALPAIITSKLLSKISTSNSGTVASSANRFRFVSNPARLQYFGQEIVVCRDDLMSRMLRNTVRLKDGERGAREVDLKKYLVSTILDQAHLCPLPQQSRPVLWEHDHALRLYPMPTALVLADKFDRYELTYEGCHVFNPSSFRGSSFGWTTYYPATGRAERSELPRA
ncbi:dna polymerase epsilon subunit b [Ceraceosorus bombacis]|uniref:DNA polymerase epsilon subunit B n=1 Tax=Ceraceosorus bombacis TaxID=401625 RepID=A0A0P1BHY2_9BASI|nr:dna polymerase epsilon subunit b [Ceraceosorus bombacis]